MSATGHSLYPNTYGSRGRSQSTVTAAGEKVLRKVWLAQSGPCALLWTNHCDWPGPPSMLVRLRAFTSYWKGFLCRKLSSTVVSTFLWPTAIFRPYLCWQGSLLLPPSNTPSTFGHTHSPGFPLNRPFLSQSLCLASLSSLTSSCWRLKAQALTSLSIVFCLHSIGNLVLFCDLKCYLFALGTKFVSDYHPIMSSRVVLHLGNNQHLK